MNSETEEVKREGREVERLQQSRKATVHRKEDRGHHTRGEGENAKVGRWVASREHLPPAVRRACLQQSLLDGYFRQVTYMRKGWSTHRGGASCKIAMVQHVQVRAFVQRYGTVQSARVSVLRQACTRTVRL